jgi:hypothetical protein
MTLTKQQDALATKLRDAGVPGAFAVLVASRLIDEPSDMEARYAAAAEFFWCDQPEGLAFWIAFDDAWCAEFSHMKATGVRYDD